MSIEFGEKISM